MALGNASPGFILPDPPAGVEPPAQVDDPAALVSILVEGGAAAYFFDYPGANVITSLAVGSQAILAFGTGTLGYGKPGPRADGGLARLERLPARRSRSGLGLGTRAPAWRSARSRTSRAFLHGRGGPRLAAG